MLLSSMDSEEDATGYSQRSAYNTVFQELRLKLAAALRVGSKRLLATYLQTLLAYPDGCTRARRSWTPGAATSSRRCRPCRRRSYTPRRGRWWTWWPPSGWRAEGCWSTSPTPGPGT